MNCKKCRARIFDYQDGPLSPREMAAMKAHMEGCLQCRTEFEAEENLARGIQVSYLAATTSLSFNPDNARLASLENAIPFSIRSSTATPADRKFRFLRWLTAGAGVAVILAAVLLGPFKPGSRGAFLTDKMGGQLSSLRSDDLPDPFQDWIEKRMIITVEDKAAGTTEKYLTDRGGTIRRIDEQGRN